MDKETESIKNGQENWEINPKVPNIRLTALQKGRTEHGGEGGLRQQQKTVPERGQPWALRRNSPGQLSRIPRKQDEREDSCQQCHSEISDIKDKEKTPNASRCRAMREEGLNCYKDNTGYKKELEQYPQTSEEGKSFRISVPQVKLGHKYEDPRRDIFRHARIQKFYFSDLIWKKS